MREGRGSGGGVRNWHHLLDHRGEERGEVGVLQLGRRDVLEADEQAARLKQVQVVVRAASAERARAGGGHDDGQRRGERGHDGVHEGRQLAAHVLHQAHKEVARAPAHRAVRVLQALLAEEGTQHAAQVLGLLEQEVRGRCVRVEG